MTPNKFIQSFGSFQSGADGYCRLATLSTEKENTVNVIGFCFEIIRRREIIVLKVQLKCDEIKLYTKTFIIRGKSHLEVILNDLRLKAQVRLSSILNHSDNDKKCFSNMQISD